MKEKKVLYIDMDGVLADLVKAAHKNGLSPGSYSDVEGIFKDLEPIHGALEAVSTLSQHYDCFIATSAPWRNISALSDKRHWIGEYFSDHSTSPFYKKMVVTHRKDLLLGDYLIDDRPNNGAKDFQGEWIHFGSQRFPNWDSVINYLV